MSRGHRRGGIQHSPTGDPDGGGAVVSSDPALALLTTATIDAIGAGRALFDDLTLLEAGRLAADAVRVDAAVAKLQADVVALGGVRSHEDFCNLLRTWGNDLIGLAEAVLTPLAPLGIVGRPLAEALVVFTIQKVYPRLAGLLSAAGVFVDSPAIGSRFDWERLRDLILHGPGVVTEDFWDAFLDAGNLQESGTVPALLAAFLVIAPETVALRSQGIRVKGLLPPPVSSGASPSWAALRQRSAGWIPITVPLVTGGSSPTLAKAPDVAGGMDPELALTLLFRSQRRPSSARTVTDFEMWLQPEPDSAVLRVAPVGDRRGHRHAERPTRPGVRRHERHLERGPGTAAGIDCGGGRQRGADLDRQGRPRPPRPHFGPPDDTRLFVRDVGLDLSSREVGEPSVELVGRAHGSGVVLTNRWFRSLVGLAGRSATASSLDARHRRALRRGQRVQPGRRRCASRPGSRWPSPLGARNLQLQLHIRRATAPGPRRRGSLRRPRRGAPALVRDRSGRRPWCGRRRCVGRLVGRHSGRRQALLRSAAPTGIGIEIELLGC